MTSQDKVDSDLNGLMAEAKQGSQLVNVNGTVSPAVLAGLFGISVANIYQYRQNGKLPPNSDATYRDSIKHYVTFLRGRAGGKVANLQEASILQKLQLDHAKTEKEWLNIKAERSELIDRELLADVFEPLFIQTKGQLASLARKHPEIASSIDNVMKTWHTMGQKMTKVAEGDLNNLIEEQMNYEPEYDEEPEEDLGAQSSFGENELL